MEGHLIGGNPLKSLPLPPVVFLWFGHTATKVGPRAFIMAAHSFFNAPSLMDPGDPLYLQKASGGAFQKLTLRTVFPHPSYERAYAHPRPWSDPYHHESHAYQAFDVALFHVEEDTPDIPMATLDFAPVEDYETVFIGGFGCEEAGGGKSVLSGQGHYTWGESIVLPSSELIDLGPGLGLRYRDHTREFVAMVDTFNIITAGPDYPSSHPYPGLCLGDSGGPLFRSSSNEWAIIGVNAHYSFLSASAGPYVNWHARLSPIADWIEETLKK